MEEPITFWYGISIIFNVMLKEKGKKVQLQGAGYSATHATIIF